MLLVSEWGTWLQIKSRYILAILRSFQIWGVAWVLWGNETSLTLPSFVLVFSWNRNFKLEARIDRKIHRKIHLDLTCSSLTSPSTDCFLPTLEIIARTWLIMLSGDIFFAIGPLTQTLWPTPGSYILRYITTKWVIVNVGLNHTIFLHPCKSQWVLSFCRRICSIINWLWSSSRTCKSYTVVLSLCWPA